MSKSYRDLTVWSRSFALATDVYDLSQKLPSTERFGLSSQLQRCAVSIPSNIAEGQQRNSSREFKQFIGIARGSAAELSTQLLLVNEVHNVDTRNLIKELEEVQKMLYSLQNKL